jgi:hypothetical protein
MIVRVDTAGGQASLEQPEDCKKFHVEASGGGLAQVAAVLGTSADAPDDHVWVPLDWVRAEATGRVPENWTAEFDGMLGYASSKGWMSPDGRSIQAHIVWS